MARAALVATVIVLLALASPAQAVMPDLHQPAWTELTPTQREILAPLAAEWDRMEAFRRKKWLDIAKRYPGISPQDRVRIQTRMKDWAALTPQQRRAARERYKRIRRAPPEQRRALREKWQQYKKLPAAERKRLAEAAARRRIPKVANRKLRKPPLAGNKAAVAPKQQPAAAAAAAPTTSPKPAGKPAGSGANAN